MVSYSCAVQYFILQNIKLHSSITRLRMTPCKFCISPRSCVALEKLSPSFVFEALGKEMLGWEENKGRGEWGWWQVSLII